jgi:hypothetical protein
MVERHIEAELLTHSGRRERVGRRKGGRLTDREADILQGDHKFLTPPNSSCNYETIEGLIH